MMMAGVPTTYLQGAYVHYTLPPIAWAMLRLRNKHSQAFRGRYSPENAPWGVEIVESQYWPHVRAIDVIGPPQCGKTFHACELPTLYDLLEARETVFYMNGSEDNAKNIWRTRWSETIQADPVLSQQLLERMEGGEWYERHFRDGGLLYSTGPQSASALSQRESRIVRCSELEKTPSAIGAEASAYSLARDRAAAYPATCLITSDCTITVRDGLSWLRFAAGDRSRPFVPCVACGHYAVPAHERHLDEPDLALSEETTHIFNIPEMAQANAAAAGEAAELACRACGHVFSDREFRTAMRAVVWVPAGCRVVREDDPRKTPVPAVLWLESLNRWVVDCLSDWEIEHGRKNPPKPPAWSGPRLPEGVKLDWSQEQPPEPKPGEEPVLPAFRPDPRKSPSRSFWLWRIFAPKYSIGQVASEIVAGETGTATGDLLDDQKNVSQKCFVLPWVEPQLGDADELTEDAVLACVCELPRGRCPENTIGIARAIDINEDAVHWTIKAATSEGDVFTIDHGYEDTKFQEWRKEHGVKWDLNNPVFIRNRRDLIYAALDRIMAKYPDGVPDAHNNFFPIRMTYVDSSYMSEEIYAWCDRYRFSRLRPARGRGAGITINGRRRGNLAGLWNEACEKRALKCQDAAGRIMKHQYFDPADPRRLMFFDADFWKREVHAGILMTARCLRTPAAIRNPQVKPYWFLHADLAPKPVAPGSKLLKHRDRFITQVIAEVWSEWENPRTKRIERGWRENQQANHLLDCEAMATAALAALGALPKYGGKPEAQAGADPARAAAVATQQPAPRPVPPVRVQQPPSARPIRRSYG